MLIYDLKYLCSEDYGGDNMEYEPAEIIIDNEAAISMAKCNKDTAGNRHVARRFHYVRQGTALSTCRCIDKSWLKFKIQVIMGNPTS